MITNDFYCTQCGQKGIPIQRKENAKRESGHLKKLWCLKCNKETNHVECNNNYTHDDFLTEFENDNFDEDGNRVMTYNQLRSVIINEENVCNGRSSGIR